MELALIQISLTLLRFLVNPPVLKMLGIGLITFTGSKTLSYMRKAMELL